MILDGLTGPQGFALGVFVCLAIRAVHRAMVDAAFRRWKRDWDSRGGR